MNPGYGVAGVGVHKSMLAVVATFANPIVSSSLLSPRR